MTKDNPLLILAESQNFASSLRTIFAELKISYLTFTREIDIFHHLYKINYTPIIFVFNLQQLNNFYHHLPRADNSLISSKIPIVFLSLNNDIEERKKAFNQGRSNF